MLVTMPSHTGIVQNGFLVLLMAYKTGKAGGYIC